MTALSRFFDLSGRGSTFGHELRGAGATFLTMAYILFTNATILGPAMKDVPAEAIITATALAAGLSCLLMGLTANFPLALASGMGLNAVVADLVMKGVVDSWQTAMGLVVLDGLIILVLVLCGLRETLLHAIPRDLRLAIGVGIGLFIAFIGAVNSKMVVVPPSTLHVLSVAPEATMPPVTHGSLQRPEPVVALVGLILTALLLAWRMRGAILIGIVLSTILAAMMGLIQHKEFGAPSLATVGQANILGALRWQLLAPLLALFMVDFFDTLGTVTAIAEQSSLYDPAGRIPNLRNILLVDSGAAAIGGLCGVSSVTSYIESAAGVAEGARTGLHSVLVGLFFLVAMMAAPLAALVPAAATAPALIIVGFLMARHIADIDFTHLDTGLPAFITLVTLPFTYSIAHGIGYGFITYVALKLLSLKPRDVHPLMFATAALFAAYFVWGRFGE